MKPSYVGKVRDVFDLGDSLILVSTDRISAFDVVFDETIPNKGKVLNHVSIAWFEFFSSIANHIIETDYRKFPEPFRSDSYLEGRSILVKKCKRIDYECVVRGYLSGSAFKEYTKTGQIAFKDYPKGMLESEKLAGPIFTPARKNDIGHDENISEHLMAEEVGQELFDKLKSTSIHLYTVARERLEKSGLILCDTKFEFGLIGDEVILIDELLTPDSSRYWEASTYKTGISPPSLDKQILRNYLETLDWDKNPPPPPLSKEIQLELKRKYEILEEIIIQCTSRK
ncbi:phosphoribosylaminoimidazolesuccinocarboxamide synthase [Leptospira sp. GIMC2001]|uniref:phosphoribosylaminoimidazolesuccinocarboxamide synthase n=1 Tax=Leptospira sp. GIMC2001 TaxID=1513297 RepID=UPI00234BF067|nr:phosphoribosylaminoimidazolesuccinocarboxamide synthase [Leptospira sp. GIMC2001]WCL51334.1 phosphoribosylaminoimidazolesuccinocarboxamide synthase [Leptospira sp. GIMC2001]